MGNMTGSTRGNNSRRRHHNRQSHPSPPPPAPPQPEISANRYVFAAATPYPAQYPNPPPPPPQYYQYPGYYPPAPLPAPYDHHHRVPHPQMDPAQANWVGGRYRCGPVLQAPTPYVEHQKAVTIRNDVNLKKESLRVEPDEQNPGSFLLSFTFDATVAGRFRLMESRSSFEPCWSERQNSLDNTDGDKGAWMVTTSFLISQYIIC